MTPLTLSATLRLHIEIQYKDIQQDNGTHWTLHVPLLDGLARARVGVGVVVVLALDDGLLMKAIADTGPLLRLSLERLGLLNFGIHF